MADIDNFANSWEVLDHGQVEDAIKAKAAQLEAAINAVVPSSGITQEMLAAALRQTIANAVPNSRKINGVSLNRDITLGPENISVGNITLAQKLDDLGSAIEDAAQSGSITMEDVNEVLQDYQPRLIAGTGIAIGSDGKTVSVDAEVVQPVTPDGTFDIRIGQNTYTINLNHTHENMAKLVVCEESDLPSTLNPATIYAITDSGETEIEKLIIRGMEFVGGGGVVDDTPRLTSPRSGFVIDFNEASTKTVLVKGVNIGDTLEISKTGDFTVTDGNGNTVSSISASDAEAGVTLTLVRGSSFAGGTLTILSSEVNRTVDVIGWREIDLSTLQAIAFWTQAGEFNYGGAGTPGPDTQKTVILPLSDVSLLSVTANDVRASFVVLLKSIPTFTDQNVDYSSYLCDGETDRRQIPADTTDVITLPSDCVAVAIGCISNPANYSTNPIQYTPSSVKIK